MLLFGNSNKLLSKAVEKDLGHEFDYVEKIVFPDGEVSLTIQNPLSGEDVFLLQATSPLVTENLLELLLTLESLKQKKTPHVTVIMSYFGYARQDQLDAFGATPLKSIVHLIEAAGASEVVVLDPHWQSLKSPFSIPCTLLQSAPLMVDDIRRQGLLDNTILVAPDQGSIPRIHPLADLLNIEVLCLEKQRCPSGTLRIKVPHQDLKEKKCLIIDDIIDSGQTLCEAARVLEAQGARNISAYVTHGVLSPGSHQCLQEAPLKELVITDSIQATSETLAHPKIRQISVAPLIADFIAERRGFETTTPRLFEDA